MSLYQLKPSFAGGELAPALYGRTDLAKYDIGASKIENMLVLRYGGVSRRPGLKYIAVTADNKPARLIPFRYSASQNYVVEITAGKCRFYTDDGIVMNGSSPYYISNTFTVAELPTIKYSQSADTMFLVQPSHAPMTLTRYGSTDWRLETMDITGGPFDDPNTTSIKISASGNSGNITLTATASYFNSGMVGRQIRLGHTIPSQYAKGVPTTTGLQVSCPPGGTVYVESFGFWDGNFTLEKYSASTDAWVKIRTQEGNRTQNYNLTETNDEDEIVSYRVTSTAFNIDVWTDENEKQRGYVTLQSFSQDYYGIVKITGIVSATGATATVIRSLANTTGTKDFSLSPWSSVKGYPGAVGFFEDRLVLAGSKSAPQTYWTSKNGDYYNFGSSIPQQDDDGIVGTLNNGQMNGIKSIISFAEMLMQTAGGTYKVSGGNNPITPTNQQSKPQEYRGINDLMPCVVGSRIVFTQQQGNIVRDIGYSYDVDKYTGDDVSLLAAHLFDGHQIISMTYQQVPNSIVWCVRDDGVLLGMTYIKEQDVYAWHRHTTEGSFIDVCSISGDTEDELWCVVKRGKQYFVELMAKQIQSSDTVLQNYVDCGVEIDNSTDRATTITGLGHLEGKTVQVLADGNVLPLQLVTDGQIKLLTSYDHLFIGLPYTSTLKTLPIEFNGNDGSYGSRKKRIARMMIMFKDSRGGKYGIDPDHLDEIKWRSNEAWDTPINLYTGKQFITVPQSGYDVTLMCMICQEDPLPMNILSIIPEVVPGG